MRPDYCPIGGEPCQSLCDEPCTIPPQRKPLTEFERMQIIGQEFPLPLVQSIVIQKIDSVCKAIEAAHGIKE